MIPLRIQLINITDRRINFPVGTLIIRLKLESGICLQTSVVPAGVSFSSIEALVSTNHTYAQREQFLIDKASGKIEELKRQKEVITVSIQI